MEDKNQQKDNNKPKLLKRSPGRPTAGKKWHPQKGYISIDVASSTGNSEFTPNLNEHNNSNTKEIPKT